MGRLSAQTILNASNVAATDNYTICTADQIQLRNVQIVWTSSSSSFSLQLQRSNDGTNWVNVGSPVAPANNNGNSYVDTTTSDGMYWRIASTRTSGTLTTLRILAAYEERT
jgi:hypothetical protein